MSMFMFMSIKVMVMSIMFLFVFHSMRRPSYAILEEVKPCGLWKQSMSLVIQDFRAEAEDLCNEKLRSGRFSQAAQAIVIFLFGVLPFKGKYVLFSFPGTCDLGVEKKQTCSVGNWTHFW